MVTGHPVGSAPPQGHDITLGIPQEQLLQHVSHCTLASQWKLRREAQLGWRLRENHIYSIVRPDGDNGTACLQVLGHSTSVPSLVHVPSQTPPEPYRSHR